MHGLRAGFLRVRRELALGALSVGSGGLARLSFSVVPLLEDPNLGGVPSILEKSTSKWTEVNRNICCQVSMDELIKRLKLIPKRDGLGQMLN